MQILARSFYLDSEVGTVSKLPATSSALENPYVYDASARELQAMATDGLIPIVDQ